MHKRIASCKAKTCCFYIGKKLNVTSITLLLNLIENNNEMKIINRK